VNSGCSGWSAGNRLLPEPCQRAAARAHGATGSPTIECTNDESKEPEMNITSGTSRWAGPTYAPAEART
jgi:hypothetical protein